MTAWFKLKSLHLSPIHIYDTVYDTRALSATVVGLGGYASEESLPIL